MLGKAGVEQEAVEVEIEGRVIRGDGADRGHLGHQVEPRPGLELERRVARCQGVLGLGGPVLRRHVVAPPRQRHPGARLAADEPVRGNAERLAGEVEHGLLEAGAKLVAPEQLRRISAYDAGIHGGHIAVPVVHGAGLAPADDPGIGGDPADLDQREVGDAAPHVRLRARGEPDVELDALDARDLHSEAE